MSARTFQHHFEETTGVPPGEWIVLERLSRARELLDRPEEMPLEQLTELCGVDSQEASR